MSTSAFIFFLSFCAVGADNALEHVNRSMKVSGVFKRLVTKVVMPEKVKEDLCQLSAVCYRKQEVVPLRRRQD